jgi:Family of unknown function (DUF6600)
MKKTRNIALLSAVMVFGFCVYGQAINLTVGSGDYYVNVGDYDYLPYAYNAQPGFQLPGLSFQSAMADYGTWVSVQPFGQVWRPYVAQGWRPFTQGHWTYTQYGPTWQGLEPWSWASDHYGNWAFTQQMGWVWIPGYEWNPGRVAWANGYNSIGWSPMPPPGYDYSRGYLSYIGPQNQFTYLDDDFSIGFGFGGGNDYYGGPYYDPRYRNSYYNPSFLSQMAGILWTFIEPNNFGYDNYANYYYGDDYARYLFDQRLIRISSQPIERVVLERIVRQPIVVRQVQTNEIQVDGRNVRVVAVEGEQEKIAKNANEVVRDVIAPAFVENGKTFKADKAKTHGALAKALKMENAQPTTETVTSEQIVSQAKQKQQQREQKRAQIKEKKKQEIVQVEREGKFKEKKDRGPNAQPQKKEDKARVKPVEPTSPPVQEQEQEDTTRRNRPADQGLPKVQDEEKRLKDRERQSTIQPETDENVQQKMKKDRDKDAVNTEAEVDTERKATEKEADVRSDDKSKEKQADTNKKKGKKPSKQKDKDKDKQNEDPPPQN